MPDFSNRFFERLAGQRLSYGQYDDVKLAKQGIVLEQNKEPALSGEIRTLCTPKLLEVKIPDLEPGDDTVTIARKAGILDENTGRPLYQLLERAAAAERRAAGSRYIRSGERPGWRSAANWRVSPSIGWAPVIRRTIPW